jgi:hypothetical protein
MTVGVDQSRHDDHFRAIDSLCDLKPSRINTRSDPMNLSVVNKDLLPHNNRLRPIQRDNRCIFQEYCHKISPLVSEFFSQGAKS